MNFAAVMTLSVYLLTAAPVFGQSVFDSEPAPNPVHDPSYEMTSAVRATSGPQERNRIWRLFNNNCARRHDETETEVNLCVAMHRDTPMPDRRAALQHLLDVGMVNFRGFSMSFMVRGLATAPPGRVLYVTRRIATNTQHGRFLSELCRDEYRMLLFLNRQLIPLE